MEPKYYNKTVSECTNPPCTNKTSEWGGKLRACSRCSVAGKAVALYCSVKCQKDDWPRHKVQCNKDQEAKSTRSESAQKTLEDMIRWDRKNRPRLIAAAISALDLCHFPENADEYMFFISLNDTPGTKYRYEIGFAKPISFAQYEDIFGQFADNPRNDQRIGQERAQAKSPSCISFQIVEYANNDGCRNTFQTWMMPKDLHGYRTAGFGVINWEEIIMTPMKTTPPTPRTVFPRFDGNLVALKSWRDMYVDDMYTAAAIDALGLDEDLSPQKILIIYLRCTGEPEISDMILVEAAFVFSFAEAEAMLDTSVWKAVELVVNGRPETETDKAVDPAPCVVCQIVDPLDPAKAPSFTVPVKLTEALLQGPRRKYSWKEHLMEMLGGADFAENLIALRAGGLY
ncbi:FAD-binding PCMH-type domain-containing protein [Favolaschia claudopus]|uniref:FAD-binding PCMH-type domain-containing protein n=1 Tax=Favolaschia claudopus TaxID=2862362 RepID=A0AAW0C3S7_9AGAR